MNIYVLGCGGMLGDALYKHFSKQHKMLATDINHNEPWLEYRDVRNYHQMHYDISNFCPNVIMNLAAMTSLEECESNAGEAIETNAGGSANCAALASKFGVPYVYISTAGIFDGKKEYYTDEDKPNPICVYAKSKYWGELIAQTVPEHIVVRCGWQMGSGPKDKKFISKIWKQIKAGATELNVVKDKVGTPTYVTDFTLGIEKLLKTKTYGTFNMVCKGEASRYDVAVEFVRLLGLQDKVKVNVVDSAFWASEYFAPRPDSEKLVSSKLDALGMNVMRHWKEALAEYVAEYSDYFESCTENVERTWERVPEQRASLSAPG
ncbi:MAG: NAD(P)-dependent oxidoreductase [Candidatus Sulfotelmatobacter sp.]